MGTSDAEEVSPPAPLASTFLRHAAKTPPAPRTPTPFRNVRRDASLLNTASNCPIPCLPCFWPLLARPADDGLRASDAQARTDSYTCQNTSSGVEPRDMTDGAW